MRALFIALFFLCIIIAKVGPIYGYFFGTEVQSSTSDTSHSSGKSVRFKLEGWRPRVKHRGRATHEDHQFNMHECQSSSDFDRALKRNAAKGIIYLYGEAFDGHNRVGQNAVGFHARDGFVCTAAHFYGFFEDLQDCVLTMTWNEKSVEIPWPILNVRLEGEDMVLFKLPQMDRPPEMYKYMLAQKDFFLIEEGQELAVISADEEGEPNVMTVHMKPVQPRVSYQVIGQTILVLSPLGYQCDTVKGDSGGMVFAESVHGKPSLVAMHLAAVKSGISKVGVAITLWKELIDDMIRTISPIQAEVFPHEVLLTVPYDKAHIPPNHSRLKRTVLYGSFPEPVEKVPAKMAPFTTSEGEFIHPLYKAMSKLHQVPTECEPCSDRCLDYLVNLYPRQHGSRVLTPYEALSEYAHPKYIPVNFGTSPGYPYSLGHGKGKAPHIYRDENEKLQFSPYFLGLLESYHTNLLNGNQIQVYWADVLKDETRPLAKVEAGKTRLFSTCPLHYLILIRMYFMDFTLYVQSLAATHPVNVGLNCSSLEWTILYKRLASKKGSVLSGDYENFDGMLPKMLGEKFVRFVNAWYNDGEVNANVRWLLMQHIFAAMHISYTKVYQVFDGNPSGNPITSIYNSFLNIMMIFIVLTEDLGLGEKEFELAVYGDDNIITMSKRGIKCSDIAPHIMRRFGMKYTHFSKEQSDVDDTLLSIRYLNRAFVAVEGILRAPLPLATMREITYWKMSSEAEVEVLKSSADSMFREMSHLPREEFKYLVDFFLEHVDKVAPHLIPYFRQVLLTYDGYIFEMYFSKVEPGKIYPGFCKQIDTGGDCPFLYFETQSHFRIVASKAGVANEVATTQNLEYTDRSTNDLAPTQQVQLGMAQDAAPVSASAMNSQVMQIPYQINNMETFDLNRAVDRMYTLGNPAWTTAQAANTVIGTYNFPDVLFAQDFITNKKNDFSYFRAGIRFVCRCTTSGFVYGTIMIVYQPNVAQDGFLVRGTNVFTGSGYPHILVSAAQGEAAILDVPFIYPKRFIDAKNPPVGSMGRFVVMVLNPLTNINGAVDAAQLTIQAQFLDAELVLPRDSTQSNPGLKKESRKKSSAGIISSALEDHQATGESLDVVKFAKPYTDFFRTFARGVGTAMEVASLMGLSKPTTVEMPKTTTLDVVSTFNYGKGIDLAKKFAMDPEAAIATRPLVGGIDQDEMDLKYVLGTPMLTSTYAMVASTPATIVGTTSPFALLGQYTYVDFVTRNFAFCSGSYKFAAYIEASNLHAVRLVFYLATTAAADYQDCYHRIVDVQGSTYVNFTVPHCVSDFTRDTTTETVYWGVYVKILSWSQPTPAVSAPIFVNVYKAAASDFKVGCLLDMMFTPQSNPRKDFAQIFDPFHPSMMGYEPNAVVYPEEYTTIREIVHRMYPHFAGDTIPVYGPSGTPRVGIELWGIIFMYFRGSVRVQALRKLTGALQATGVARVSGLFLERTDVAGTNIPGLDIGFADKPALSGEAPWYSNLAYKSTTVSEAPVYQFNVPDTVGDSFFCKSAGDDFTYMFLCPPPAGLLAPTDATRGYNALKTWISS